jgi:uncharacterized protein YprB with RNaseH-like and TPR domain
MPDDLRDRLRKLNIQKGARHITPKPKPKRSFGIESLIDGEIIETDYGPAFVHIERYAPDHVHGAYPLGELLSQSRLVAGHLASLDEEIDLRRVAFIDTETTGLAGGTGTLAFLIGVGTFEDDDSFTLRQFFLRSPAEEPATLLHLAEWLDQFEAIVSFNGRGFDVPLLQTRFILHRLRPALLSAPNLDLLTPARRVWRGRLESCSLKSLEYHILDVHRDQDDIDGSLIPQIYFDYARTGDAREMPRVLYHNAFDILSMVTLATRLIQIFDEERTTSLTAADWYALGKWHADRAEHDQAERYLRQAVEDLADALTHQQAAMRLSLLYKQLDRRADAIGLWEVVALQPSAANLQSSIEACIELAKYYEWHAADVGRALDWTDQALALAASVPDRLTRNELTAELEHRRVRLSKKRDRAAS